MRSRLKNIFFNTSLSHTSSQQILKSNKNYRKRKEIYGKVYISRHRSPFSFSHRRHNELIEVEIDAN